MPIGATDVQNYPEISIFIGETCGGDGPVSAAPLGKPPGSGQSGISHGQDFSPGPLVTRIIVICETKLVRDAIVRNIVGSKLSVITEGYRLIEDWEPAAIDEGPIVVLYWGPNSRSYPKLESATSSIVSKSANSRVIVVSEMLDIAAMKQAYAAGAKAFIGVQASFNMLRSIIQLVIMGQFYFPFELLTEGRALLQNSSAPSTRVALTPRQQSIVECLSKGMTNREIANHLDLKEPTVKADLLRIMRKMGVRTRAEIAYRFMKT